VASNPEDRTLLRDTTVALLATLFSSAALYLGTGLHPIWWITWIAPLPILLAAPRLPLWSVFLIALLTWSAGGLNMWLYFRELLTIPLLACLGIILLPALVFALIALLFRALLLRNAIWQAALVFPTAWVTYEYVSSLLSPHSTFGNISYSQMNFLPVVQLTSVTGIWGISFCLFLFPAALAAVFSSFGDRRQKLTIAATVFTFLVIVLGFGYARLHAPYLPAASVTVGLVSSDLPQNLIAQDHDNAMRLMREYSEQAESLTARGAQIVVVPEKSAVVLDSYRAPVDALFQSIVTRTGATIIVGLIDVTGNAKWNEARLYSPASTSPTAYAKHHMLPMFESQLTPGSARTEIDQPSGRWGVTICKDMDFPLLSREYGKDGTALLLVPAWDFNIDGWLHGRMAILRGVESGFTIVRAAKQGVLTVSDSRGRIVAEQTTGSSDFTSLVASAPVRHDATLYARFGDWLAWMSVVGLVSAIVGLRKHR